MNIRPDDPSDDTQTDKLSKTGRDTFLHILSLERIYDEFERAWSEPTRPLIEGYLERVHDSVRPTVLRELLGIELDQRLKLGEAPLLADYNSRFPDQVEIVQEVYRESARSHIGNPIPEIACFDAIYRLGRGGQGEVWLTHDRRINRLVALKILKPSLRSKESPLSSFLREVEICGKLEHPNIIPLYEVTTERDDSGNTVDRSLCYVMRLFGDVRYHDALVAYHERPRPHEDRKLLDALQKFDRERTDEHRQELVKQLAEFNFATTLSCDQTLKKAIESMLQKDSEAGPMTKAIKRLHREGCSDLWLRKLLSRFQRVCEGAAYAHSRGVIHRDLKPENIMLGEFGETLVVDWGLAKAIGPNAQATDTGDPDRPITLTAASPHQSEYGQGKGTLIYMSPEQAKGLVNQQGPATDIYSLGAILYYLVSGQTAFESPRNEQEWLTVLSQVRNGQFAPPKSVNPVVPKPLEAIVLKAMSLEPKDRYASALDLAADVENWLNDRPVSSWTEPWPIRARRWMKQHQTAVTSCAAAIVMAMVTLSFMYIVVAGQKAEISALLTRETAQRKLAEANKLEAESQRNAAHAAQLEAETNAGAAKQQSQLALKTVRSIMSSFKDEFKPTEVDRAIHRRLVASLIDGLAELSTKFIDQGDLDRLNEDTLLEIAEELMDIGLDGKSNDFIEQAITAFDRMNTGNSRASQGTEAPPGIELAIRIFEHVYALRKLRLQLMPVDARLISELAEVTDELAAALDVAGDIQASLTRSKECLELCRLEVLTNSQQDQLRPTKLSSLWRICLNSLNQPAEFAHYSEQIRNHLKNVKDQQNVKDQRIAKAVPALLQFLIVVPLVHRQEFHLLEPHIEPFAQAIATLPDEFGDYKVIFRIMVKSMVILAAGARQPHSLETTQVEELVSAVDRLANARSVPQRHVKLVLVHYRLASITTAALGTVDLQASIGNKALVFAERILEQYPENLDAKLHIYSSEVDKAMSLCNAKRFDEAEAAMSGLLERIQAVSSLKEATVEWLRLETYALSVLSMCGVENKNQKQVLKYAEIQVNANARITDLDSSNSAFRMLALSQLGMAMAQQALGSHDAAIRLCNEALETLDHISIVESEKPIHLAPRADALRVIWQSRYAERKYDDALRAGQAELVFRRKLVALSSNDSEALWRLCDASERVGLVTAALQRFDNAIVNYRECLTVLKKLSERNGWASALVGQVFAPPSTVPSKEELQLAMTRIETFIQSCEKWKISTGSWSSLAARPETEWESLVTSRMMYYGLIRDDQALSDMAEYLTQRRPSTAFNLIIGSIAAGRSINLTLGWLGVGDFNPQHTIDVSKFSPELQARKERTLSIIKAGIEAGYWDGPMLESENAFTIFKRLPAFDQLVMSAHRRKFSDALAGTEERRDVANLAALFQATNRLGDAQSARYQTDDALLSCEKSIEIAKLLMEAAPDNAELLRLLSSGYLVAAQRAAACRDTTKAQDYYMAAIDIAKRRAEKLLPRSGPAKRLVAELCEQLHFFAASLSDWRLAKEAAQDSLVYARAAVKLATREEPVEWDFINSYWLCAESSKALGSIDAAVASLEEAMHIDASKLASKNAETKTLMYSLAISERLGDMAVSEMNNVEANRYYADMESFARRLMAQSNADQIQLPRLDIIFEKVATARLRLEEFDDALRYYEASLQIRKDAAMQQPNDVNAQRNVMVSHQSIGDVYVRTGQYMKAIEHFDLGLAVVDDMLAAGLQGKTWKAQKLILEEAKQFCRLTPMATADLNLVLQADPTTQRYLLRYRATQLARLGRTQDLAETAAKLRELHPQTIESLYRAACAYGQCAMLSTKAKPQSTQSDFTERNRFRDLAMECLRDCIEAGYEDFDQMHDEPALTVLRELPEFHAFHRKHSEKLIATATGDLETIRKSDAESLPLLLSLRATELAKQGQLTSVVQAADMLRELANDAKSGSAHDQKGGLLYNAACAYCLCVTLSQEQQSLPNQSEQVDPQKWFDLALNCLQESFVAGFSDVTHLEQDPELALLRGLPEFHAILKDHAAKSSPKSVKPKP